MTDGIPFQQYPPQFWQGYLNKALLAHRQNPQDEDAMQAVRDATMALNEHEKVNAGMQANQSFESLQGGGLGSDLSNAAGGAWDAAKGIPRGIGQMLGQVGRGDITGALKGIGSGLAQTGRGAIAPWELALRELSGEQVPEAERAQKLRGGGGAVTGLEAMALPGQVSRGIGAMRGSPSGASGLPGPDYTPFKPPVEPEPPEPTPSGATPTQPLTPIEGTGGRGFSAEGPPTKPVTPAMEALSKLTAGRDAFAKLDPEAILAKGAASGMSRVAGQKGVTFGSESPLGDAAQASVKDLLGQMTRNPEAGFSTPEMMILMAALGGRLGLAGGALNALKGVNYGALGGRAATGALTGAGMQPDTSTGIGAR